MAKSKFLIDPTNITKFNCEHWELELLLLFWICAAGKNALTSAQGLDRFMTQISRGRKPFEAIRQYGHRRLPTALKRNGIGCYNGKAKSFWELANSGLDLRTCSIADLESIHGIGMKTSRCFVMHSRAEANCAGLDVHILRYLGDQGYDVPKATPPKKEYLRIEKVFVELAKKSGLSTADFDLKIWKEYSGRAS